VVTATQTITNSDYRATADGNLSAVGEASAITTIVHAPVMRGVGPQTVLCKYRKSQKANGSMEDMMENRWLWKVIMIPACLVLAFGLLSALYPDIYMDFYLSQSANTTLETMSETQPEISLLLEVIFRANGLGMIMSGILAVFIILFAFRKGKTKA
jgi:hypothetical protein